MTQPSPKLRLSQSRDIPFDKLILSQANVRRVKTGISIEELAEDIARRTLLQSLNVRAVIDPDGKETGQFEVPAGGRRFRALELLVKAKRMTKNQPVPCIIREGGSAEEDSLAENVQRVALHPLDQFRAFKTLRDAGATEEEIAARFFVPVSAVKQRLRLASVSEALLDIYAEDGMTLDQLMAFTITHDHARQEQVWADIGQGYNNQPYNIRRLLTEESVPITDRRALFIGISAYETAGGFIMRDLFTQDQGGWLQDPALLDRLVSEKLGTIANELASEGWKWIEAAIDLPYGYEHGLRRLTGTVTPPTDVEQAQFDELAAEFDQLTSEYDGGDDLPDEVDARLGELEDAMAPFVNRPTIYEPNDVAQAGVFITLASDGHVRVDRGYVRREDEAPADGGNRDVDPIAESGAGEHHSSPITAITIGRQASELEPAGEDDDDVIKPLPDRLVGELTAERTLALRDALAQAPDAAFIALLHALCQSCFGRQSSHGCVEISVRQAYFGNAAADLNDSKWARTIKLRHDAWAAILPDDANQLWDVLIQLEPQEQMDLLAHCTSLSVNALYEPANRYNQGQVSAYGVSKRLQAADHLARTVGLDMAHAGWQPTASNYLNRVTKPRIMEAVREARGEETVHLIAHLKKGDMAKEAERLLEGSGWLPEPLRLIDLGDGGERATETTPIEELPAFLGGDDEPVDEDIEPEPEQHEAHEPLAVAA